MGSPPANREADRAFVPAGGRVASAVTQAVARLRSIDTLARDIWYSWTPMLITSRPVSTGSAFVAMFFLGVGVAIVGATARAVGLAPSQIGYLIAAQNVGFGVSVVVSGALADRFRKPLILTVGLIMLGLSFATLYRSDSFAANLGVMLLMGGGMGVAEAVTDAWLLEMHERNESRLVTINHLAVSVGSVVITLYLMALKLDWETSLGRIAVLLGLLAVLVAFLRPAGHVSRRGSGGGDIRKLSTDPGIVLLALAAMGTVGVEIGSAGVITTFAVQLRGVDPDTAQLLLALYLISLAAGRVVMGVVGSRGRPGRMVVGAAAAAFLSSVVLYLVPLPAQIVPVPLFVLGLTAGPLLPLTIAAAGLRYRHLAGTAMGMVKVAIPVGGIAIPGLVGLLSDTVSFPLALGVFPLAALLVLVSAIASERRAA